ncbi:MAG: hypothetical protein EA403_03230 [Spirochaetaceae bacterium]|nr:MAG: hypothetical protein EA403_03230 [Spirochaetaceae bacterium]
MVCGRRYFRSGNRTRLVTVALLLLLVAAQGLAEDPEPLVAVVSPQRVREGERILIGVELPPTDASLVRVEEPAYPAGVRRATGVQVVSRGGGPTGPRATSAQIELQAIQAGRWIIPPIGFETPSGRFITEHLLVEISLRDNIERIPFELQWRVHRDPVLEGQSVAVTLEMVNVTEFTFPESISVQPPTGALFEEAQGIGEISASMFGTVELFRFPVASFLLTPSAAGSIVLPAAEIQALGFTRRAPAITVPVRSLPEGAQETGAVGNFSFSAELTTREIGMDETAELVVRVAGTGNLGFLQFPDLRTEGFVVADTVTEDRFVAGPSGFTGERVRTVSLRPTGTGSFRIEVDAFSWLDPESMAIRRQPAQNFVVRVLEDAPQVDAPERDLPALLSADEVRRVANLDLFRRLGTYLSLTPVAILIVVVTFVRRRRREKIALFSLVALLGFALPIPGPPSDAVDAVDAAFAVGEYESAWQAAITLTEEWPDHPGLMYNAAITAFASERPAQSVYLLRTALVLRPVFRHAHHALDFVESARGLNRQFSRPRTVHPDGPLLAVILLWYLVAVLIVVPRKRRSARYAIAVIVTALMLLVAIGGFAYALHQRNQAIAVVGEREAGLRRIPEQGAQTWLTLDPGTAVLPLTTRDEFVLIRTGYGIDGWIPMDQLLQREQ